MRYDNTVGSRLNTDLAYIAGFLDGDGSLMLQIKKRKDGRVKARFMATICFYQDTRHEKTLFWIRDVLEIGYISRRKDGMSELRINGYAQVKNILVLLLPYIRFKAVQAKEMIHATTILSSGMFRTLQKKQVLSLIDSVLRMQNENYVTKKKKTREELFTVLGLTP